MATPRRRPRPSLKRILFLQAPRFDFFQAVRLLGRLRPRRRSLGRDGSPSGEAVRFTTKPSLLFDASAVRRLSPPDRAGRPVTLETSVLSLTSTRGALPYCYTEELLARFRDFRDGTPTAFLDIFQHRLISLFYLAWERHRPALALERSWDSRRAGAANTEVSPEPDWFADHLFAIIGLGLPALRGRNTFPDEALLAFVGLFADRHRPAFALEALLREYFGLPVEVIQFIERRLRLEPEDRTTLGLFAGRSNTLGVDLIVGDRMEDVSGTFRIRFGSLSKDQFVALAPDGDLIRRITEMTRLFVGVGIAFEFQLVLQAILVPDCLVSSNSITGRRLGRDTWVKSVEHKNDAEDVVFTCNA